MIPDAGNASKTYKNHCKIGWVKNYVNIMEKTQKERKDREKERTSRHSRKKERTEQTRKEKKRTEKTRKEREIVNAVFDLPTRERRFVMTDRVTSYYYVSLVTRVFSTSTFTLKLERFVNNHPP